MIIYLIVKGDYYEHVCAVTEKKQNAERLRELFSSNYSTAEIKEFDTNTFNQLATKGYRPFYITASTDGARIFVDEDTDLDYNDFNNIVLNSFGNYTCHIAAVDEEKAKKIFRALLAEYKAKGSPTA